MDGNSKSRNRWNILREVIKNKQKRDQVISASSKRSFSSFDLFESAETSRHDNVTWSRIEQKPFEFSASLRLLCGSISLEELIGFNNTGNICIWPSEEVMAYYCLKHSDMFRDKSVLEIGGGMTCLAGVCVAKLPGTKRVLLSDGNSSSISNLREMVRANDFGAAEVDACQLCWDRTEPYEQHRSRFDVVVCADCLFFESIQEDLLHVLRTVVSETGVVLVFAPQRSGTFEQFAKLAESRFHVSTSGRYDDVVWDRHLQAKATNEDYDDNIHYPLFMELRPR